jgi:hypothetical protein
LRKKMSAHCMQGYMIWAALSSSLSARPMIWEQRRMRFRLLRRAMSMTRVQYSSGEALMTSLLLRNSTRLRSMPTAFHT